MSDGPLALITAAPCSWSELCVCAVGPRHQCLDVLGRLRIHAAQLSQQKGLLEIDPAREEWLWVQACHASFCVSTAPLEGTVCPQDFPLVTRGDDGEWESTHHPFTAPTWEQEALMAPGMGPMPTLP